MRVHETTHPKTEKKTQKIYDLLSGAPWNVWMDYPGADDEEDNRAQQLWRAFDRLQKGRERYINVREVLRTCCLGNHAAMCLLQYRRRHDGRPLFTL